MDNLTQEIYQEIILEEANIKYGQKGQIDEIEGLDYASHQYNPTCGDDIILSFSIEKMTISKVFWKAQGCSISVASASILSKLAESKTLEDMQNRLNIFKKLMSSKGEGLPKEELDLLGDASVFQGTSKFPARIKCALLSWMALEEAMAKYHEKQ